VWKLDRIGRSTKHLIDLMSQFVEKGIHFVSLKESVDTSTPTGKLVSTIFAALAEFESRGLPLPVPIVTPVDATSIRTFCRGPFACGFVNAENGCEQNVIRAESGWRR
jgi:hypothetical protein